MNGITCVGGPLDGESVLDGGESFVFEQCKYVLTRRSFGADVVPGQVLESVEVVK
jgi:hypothetical protein